MLIRGHDDKHVLLVCLQETRGALSPGLAAKPSPARQADLTKRMQGLQKRLQVRASSQPCSVLLVRDSMLCCTKPALQVCAVTARLVSTSGGRAASVHTQECLSRAGACVSAKPSRFPAVVSSEHA